MRPLIRGTISLFAVIAAYWMYCLLAVPWIEPVARQRESSIVFGNTDNSSSTAQMIEELRPLFPPNAPELMKPKVLANGPIRLLFDKYENRGDGQMLIWPCTVVYTPDDPGLAPEERIRRSIVMQVPQGAILQFDEALNLFRGKIGQFQTGLLRGTITIRSDMREPGAQDDLWIQTRDVQISDSQLYTPHEVAFRLGPNQGRGKQMWIRLAKSDAESDQQFGNFNVKGLDQFQLQELERLYLQPSGKSADANAPPASRLHRFPVGAGDSDSDLPIEISCKGPFVFDPVRQKATFEKSVDVLRNHPNGKSDQINCEMLTIHFARSRDGVVDLPTREPLEPAPRSALLSLQPARIEAVGMPVVARLPNQDVEARGERLVYDVQTQRVTLENGERVTLRQGGDIVEAKRIVYESPVGNPVGVMEANGPGWIRGKISQGDGETFHARWNGNLKLRPSEGEHVLSATQGVELEYGALGRLTAGEVFFWCREVPKPPGLDTTPDRPGPRLAPARALLRHQVDMRSSQLDCQVDQLEMWFKQNVAITGSPYYYGQRSELPDESADGADTMVPVVPRGAAAATAPTEDVAGEPASHYTVQGKVLQVGFLLDTGTVKLEQLAIEGQVRLTETRTAVPGERPILVTGHEIHASALTTRAAEMIILGTPAHFEGRGLGLTGSNICLNQGVNRLWVNGEGQMDLPMNSTAGPLGTRRADPGQASDNGPLIVRWTDHMEFDGHEAQFHGNVVAHVDGLTTRRRLETSLLRARLNRRVEFGRSEDLADPTRLGQLNPIGRPSGSPLAGQDGQARPERIICTGGVFMESFTFDGPLQTARERMQLENLEIRLDTDEIVSTGGGWVKSVRRGSIGQGLPGAGEGSALLRQAAQSRGPSGDELTYWSLRFQDGLRGRMAIHEIRVAGQVQCVYGPVKRWDDQIDEARLEDADPRTVMLTCRELIVAETPVPHSNQRAVELIAIGNTVIEGDVYTARGDRVTYAESKDLLILEGNDRADAVLFRQPYIGAPRSEVSGRRISFWPSQNRFEIQGARGSEISMQ